MYYSNNLTLFCCNDTRKPSYLVKLKIISLLKLPHLCGATLISILVSIFPYDCRLDIQCFWACFRKRRGDLSLEFWSVWWKEEEIIHEKGEKSIKVTPLYGRWNNRYIMSMMVSTKQINKNKNILINTLVFKINFTYSFPVTMRIYIISTQNIGWSIPSIFEGILLQYSPLLLKILHHGETWLNANHNPIPIRGVRTYNSTLSCISISWR